MCVLVFSQVLFDTPWGAHYGVLLTLSTHFNEVLAKQLVKPSKLKGAHIQLAEQAAQEETDAVATRKLHQRNPLCEPGDA